MLPQMLLMILVGMMIVMTVLVVSAGELLLPEPCRASALRRRLFGVMVVAVALVVAKLGLLIVQVVLMLMVMLLTLRGREGQGCRPMRRRRVKRVPSVSAPTGTTAIV